MLTHAKVLGASSNKNNSRTKMVARTFRFLLLVAIAATFGALYKSNTETIEQSIFALERSLWEAETGSVVQYDEKQANAPNREEEAAKALKEQREITAKLLGEVARLKAEAQSHSAHTSQLQEKIDARSKENAALKDQLALAEQTKNLNAAQLEERIEARSKENGELREKLAAAQKKNLRESKRIAPAIVSTQPSRHLGGDIKPNSPYAYSWILGGIDLNFPNYRGYLYGVFISAYQLRRLGSQADMLLWVEFHHSNKNPRLLFKEQTILRKLNIQLITIPSFTTPSFYELQLQKFRILGLTQYRRIMHLDGDVLPTFNLDYFFEQSDPQSPIYRDQRIQDVTPLLEENFVVNGPNDMANGGFFILAPKPGELEQIQAIIKEKEERIAQNGGKFDNTYGWGHKHGEWIGASYHPDSPNAKNYMGQGWTWFAASGDQGLLWHWVAYVKRRFSRAGRGDDLERWVPVGSSPATFDNLNDEIVRMDTKIHWPFPEPNRDKGECYYAFCKFGARSNFYHFMGQGKPWKNVTSVPKWEDVNEQTKFRTPEHLWRYVMLDFNKKYKLGMNFSKDDFGKEKSVPYKLGQNPKDGVFTNLLTK